jgi:hypothetical protein
VYFLDQGIFEAAEMYIRLISAEYSNWQLLMVLVACTEHQISFGDEIKTENMGGTCRK